MSQQIPTSHSHLQSSQHFLQLRPMFFPYYCPVPPQLSPSSSSNTASSTTTVDADSSTSSSSGAATPITHQHQQPMVHQLGNANVPCQPQQLPRFVSTSNNNVMVSGPFAPPSAECITSGDNKNVNIELANKELWEKFHRVTNEMVVTRTGRKMFPKLELNLRGLDPNRLYSLTLCMRQLDTLRYKYQAGGWSPAGQDDSSATVSKIVNHHDAWNRGEFWMSQEKLCFDRVKLTNREMESNALISLCSMHKYQPVVRLYVMNGQGNGDFVCSFEPPATQFIAVTAYQSEAITRLKVEYNPFAKGFREGSSRKRTLSPSPISERNAPNDFLAGCPSVKRPLFCPSAPFASPSAVPSFPMFSLYSSVPTWNNNPLGALLAASMAASSMSNGPFTSGYQQNSQMTTELSKVYSRFYQQQQTSRSNGEGKDEQ
uniref:T-box domain-containing protein n=1 Tax=Globodera pallida TaxID=36090 RepID=A0A183BW27_GLOPA